MTYLLDTNVVVAMLRDKPRSVRGRLKQAQADEETIALSSVVLFELWYGVAKSSHPVENGERMRILLSGDLELVDFDDQDALAAGTVRAKLERQGTPIGAYDLLIAGQALRRGWTLVTANTSEFARVDGLSWQDWTT